MKIIMKKYIALACGALILTSCASGTPGQNQYTLGNFFEANNQRLAQQGVRPGQSNANGIAGKLILSGMLPKDAYVQAYQIYNQQQFINQMRY